MSKLTLAAMRLPRAAQTILSNDPSVECRAALAASPHTDQSVLSILVRDRMPAVRRFAFLRIADTGLLAEELSRPKSGISTPYAARNPNAPKDLLVRSLASPNAQTALGAYVNPSTPEDARRELKPERAHELVDVGGSNHDRVVRAHELVVNNPWMLEDAGAWDGNVRRALAGLPQATEEHLSAITAAGRSGGSAGRAHPLRRLGGAPLTEMSAIELSSFGGPAFDMAALARSDFDSAAARAVITRRRPQEAEPHVIGRIVNRFGPEVLEHEMVPALIIWSGTRFKAAGWVAPIMGFLNFNMPAESASLRPAVEILASNVPAWETFLRLIADSWEETPLEAAEAALNL